MSLVHAKRSKDVCLCGASVFGAETGGGDAVTCPGCRDVRGDNLVHHGPVDLDTALTATRLSKYLCPGGCLEHLCIDRRGGLYCKGCGQAYAEPAA